MREFPFGCEVEGMLTHNVPFRPGNLGRQATAGFRKPHPQEGTPKHFKVDGLNLGFVGLGFRV